MKLRLLNFLRQSGRFLLVGGGATVLDFMAFVILIQMFPTMPKVCFAAAFTLSVFCRFMADKHYTFQNKSTAYGRQFVLYIAACLLTMTIGIWTFNLSMHLGADEIWSKLISIPFVTLSGFVVFRFVVFRL